MRTLISRLRALLAIGILAALLLPSLFLAVLAGRSGQAHGCLAFTSAQGAHLLDVGSGVALPQRQVTPQLGGRPIAYSAHWLVFPQLERSQLRFRRIADGQEYTLPVEGDMYYMDWSPDGRWFGYLWRTKPGQVPTLTLIDFQPSASGAPTLSRHDIPEAGYYWRWSPRGNLVFLNRDYLAQPHFAIFSVSANRLQLFPYSDTLSGDQWLLDGDERQFAYLTSQGGSNVQLYIADLEAVRARYPLGILPYQMLWSPHNRYLVLILQVFPRWQIVIVDAEGNFHDVARVAQRGDMLAMPLVHWSANGETLYYLQDEGASPLDWHWIGYQVAARSYRRIVPNVVKRPYFSPQDAQQLVLIQEQAGKRNAILMQLSGDRRVTLAEAAEDMGDPYWSRDGKYVALVWATGTGARRVLRLTVVNAETGQARTLSDGLWDARDLRWLAGSTSLFFVAERDNGRGQPTYSAELLVPQTGEQRILSADKTLIGTVLWQGNDVEFWWRVGRTFGVSRHAPNGDLIFSHSFPDDGTTPVTSAMFMYEPESFVLQPPYPQAFLAPSSGFVALKVGQIGAERLYIAKPNGTWHLIRENLSGLGDPLWSADGVYLAFTQAVNGAQVTLEIVNANGALIRRVEGYQGLFRNLRWTRCGYFD
jgi:hypothetical protein